MGHAPVHAQAFPAQVHRVALLVAQQRANAVEAALQVVVANEDPRAVHITRRGFTQEQVRADHQLLAGRFELVGRLCAGARGAGEELRPLAGDQVRRREAVALVHLFREGVQGRYVQSAGADRVER
ncbi:hypothetical protein D3C81_1809660 [compost metagenome]